MRMVYEMIRVNDLKNTTVVIEHYYENENKKHVGTAFILKVMTLEGIKYFLCSCAHVFEGDGLKTCFSIPARNKKSNEYLPDYYIKTHNKAVANQEMDIAYIDITDKIIDILSKYETPIRFIEISDIISNNERQMLDDADDIFFVGYHGAFAYDLEKHPLILKGNIATPIRQSYNNGFLSYIRTEGGISGAPVYVFFNDTYKILGTLIEANIREHKVLDVNNKEKTIYEYINISQCTYTYNLLDLIQEEYVFIDVM